VWLGVGGKEAKIPLHGVGRSGWWLRLHYSRGHCLSGGKTSGSLLRLSVLLSDDLDEAFTEAAAHLDGEAYGCL
jgi:hypothetical protein